MRSPSQSGRPISQWSGREIAQEMVQRGIVESISPRHAARLLKKGASNRIGSGTGIQALERLFPDLPMQVNLVLHREFEYIRPGTLSWFFSFDVVTGQVIEPSWGPTRNEADCLAHVQRLIVSDPTAKK